MKEIIIYSIAAIAGITVFGYSIHMLIGGLVKPQTETIIITIVCLLAAGAIAFMTWDVIKTRRGD